jgi:hypothetical protein
MIGDKELTGEQIRTAGIEVLFRELGPVAAIRFLQMFDGGKGDYTAERHEWVDTVSLEQAVEEIRQLEAKRHHSA